MAYSTGFFGADHKPHHIEPPYSENPYKDAWIRGWRKAKVEHERGIQFTYNPFPAPLRTDDRQNRQRQKQKQQAEFFAKQKAKQPQAPRSPAKHTKWNTVKDIVNLNRLTNKFNNKYRTTV